MEEAGDMSAAEAAAAAALQGAASTRVAESTMSTTHTPAEEEEAEAAAAAAAAPTPYVPGDSKEEEEEGSEPPHSPKEPVVSPSNDAVGQWDDLNRHAPEPQGGGVDGDSNDANGRGLDDGTAADAADGAASAAAQPDEAPVLLDPTLTTTTSTGPAAGLPPSPSPAASLEKEDAEEVAVPTTIAAEGEMTIMTTNAATDVTTSTLSLTARKATTTTVPPPPKIPSAPTSRYRAPPRHDVPPSPSTPPRGGVVNEASAAATGTTSDPKIPTEGGVVDAQAQVDDDKEEEEDDDDDVVSQAAVTYAALAAAATANHRSPAEAARSARIAAQTILFPPTPSQHQNLSPTSSSSSGGRDDHHPSHNVGAAASSTSIPKNVVRALPISRIIAMLRQQLDPHHGAVAAASDAASQVPARPVEEGSGGGEAAPHPPPQPRRGRIAPKGGGSSRIARHLLSSDHLNVGLLRHLFWINCYLLVDDELDSSGGGTGGSGSVAAMAPPPPPPSLPCYEQDDATLSEACAAFWALLHKVDGAYESLVSMLPTSSTSSGTAAPSTPRTLQAAVGAATSFDFDVDDVSAPEGTTGDDPSVSSSHSSFAAMVDGDDSMDYETPVVVPDLLPPCTAPRGDATLAFFRACVGNDNESPAHATGQQKASTVPQSLTQQESSTSPSPSDLSTAASSAATAAPSSPGKGAAAPSSSSFLGMFKRTSLTSPVPSSSASPGPVGSTAAAAAAATSSNLLGAVFRKKGPFRTPTQGGAGADETSNPQSGTDMRDASGAAAAPMSAVSSSTSTYPPPGCYTVKIEREMLGLTVENVLERTVVRTVLPGGPAKKAGAQVGSLITAVGNTSTRNLTHFETIDELRQSQRPLLLVLKHVGDDALRMAREEMGRLIRGAGFGITDEERPGLRDVRLEAYSHLIKRRWDAAAAPAAGGGGVDRLGEKLLWLLTLFAFGLEREAARLESLPGSFGEGASPRRRHSVYSHTSQDYSDAAKSVGKVLWDYSRKKLQLPQHRKPMPPAPPPPPPPLASRRAAALHTPGRAFSANAAANASTAIHEKPLLQIGDVLQRTRTFLADTTSPPAALLRGELISFLCDVLDMDTEMELAEDESVSSSLGGGVAGVMGGGGNAVINDLGSAGSLLKLIVLNAPIMRSPGCDAVAVAVDEEELRRRFGNRESAFTSDDVHRLHAGNRFLSIVHRLAASRSTSARITACSLGPVLWGHLDFPHQLQLRGVITRALHDVEVIVRKSTATVLHEIAELVFDRRCVPWLVLMCERAMTDPEPQLRSAAMTLTWHLAEHLPNAFLGNASQGSRYLRRLPSREDPIFADVYLLQCKLLPVATRLAEDRSPSVRLAVAAQCDRLCDALGDHWSSVIIDVLLALLSDSDERVRCEAVACVPRLAEIVLLNVAPGGTAVSEVSILEALLPASMKLQADSSSSVRIALAAAAGELLALLVSMQARVAAELHHMDSSAAAASQRHSTTFDPEEASRKYKAQVDDRMIPLVQTLLNDKDPEVTSAALRAVTNATRRSVQPVRHRHMSTASIDDDAVSLSSYHSHASDQKSAAAAAPVLAPVLSETQVLRLLPTLSELAGSRQWRVRQSAVEIVPALLGCTSQMPTRREISKLCVRLLMGDDVDAVRRSAAECLCMGGSNLGSHGEDASAEYMTMIVVPAIRNCATHPSSKQRLLSLKMVQTVLLSGACPAKWKDVSGVGGVDSNRVSDTPIRELASIALSLTGDPIANVRLNVGRSLEPVLHVFDDDDLAFIQQVLLQQVDHEESDGVGGGVGVTGGGDRDVLYFARSCVQRSRQILDDRAAGGGAEDAKSRTSY